MNETRHDTGLAPESLATLLDRWAGAGLLTREQAEEITRVEALRSFPTPRQPTDGGGRRGQLAVEAVAYLGGVLALAAAFLLVQLLWDDLSDAGRLAVPVAAACCLFVAGAIVPAGSGNAGLTRLRSALWLLALGAAGAALAVLGDQVLDLAGEDTFLLVGLGTLTLALPVYLRTLAPAQQLGLFGAAVVTAAALGARADWDEPTLTGLSMWVVAVAWFALAERRVLQPPVVGRYLAAVGAVVSAMLMGGSLGGQGVMLVTLAGLFAWAIRSDSIGLLAVASLGTVQAVPSVIQYFFPDDTTVAVPVLLLSVGTVLVAVAVTVTRRRGHHP